jgi:biotin-(acetyl-CoA carboxylase) ligase
MTELKTLKDLNEEVELKEVIINLINQSSRFRENFIFEEMQGYMNLSDPTNPKWNENVRLRMIENNEAFQEGSKQTLKDELEFLIKLNDNTSFDQMTEDFDASFEVPKRIEQIKKQLGEIKKC